MTRASLAAVLCFALASGACVNDSDTVPGGDVGAALSHALGGAGVAASPDARRLAHDIYEPSAVATDLDVDGDTCAAVETALWSACDGLYASGRYAWCTPQVAFFFAHEVPRCGARVIVSDVPENHISDVWAFDLSGRPYNGPPAQCGNGEVEPGEECDDGNHDSWDGCDPNCMTEEFTGCEAVIEHHYALAEVAVVDQAQWSGPRSHIMVHDHAAAMRAVDAHACNAAVAVGADVCNELVATMPFVAWCSPAAELVDDALGPGCAVQFQVGFGSRDPENGVFTTALPGLLSFTIR
jgi:cysteine-rich repeat protein